MGMRRLDGPRHETPFGGTVRLIFTDIDGTFVDADKRITPGVRAAARETVRRGLPLAFATGRMYRSVRPWLQELGLNGLQIVSNGAEIVRPEDGSYVERLAFGPSATSWLMRLGESHGFVPLVFSCHGLYVTGPFEGEELLARNNEYATYRPAEELRGLSSEKIVYLATGERVPVLERLAEEMAVMERPSDVDFTAVFSESGILNIIPRGASKLNAIRAVCARLGCSLADVMAIGDGDNDAEMLAGVGCGVAMGNATERARLAANFQVDDHLHDGAAQALEFAWSHAPDSAKS